MGTDAGDAEEPAVTEGEAEPAATAALLETEEKALPPPPPPLPPLPLPLPVLVGLYAAVSSTLSIANKWAVLQFPYAGVLTACQFATTAGAVGALGAAGVLKDVSCGAIKMDKVRAMAPINVVFYAAIFSNAKLLQHSNVETFIAFRSATPLLVASVDTLARGQALPSARTAGALALIAIGAVGYALADDGISLTAYFWAFSYLAIIVTEMVYAKHVVSSIGLTTWELVLYQNMIALCIWPFASLLSGELAALRDAWADPPPASAALPVAVTCVLGMAISFAGWATRSAISATSFTVLGVACKLATVAINLLVWDHHASGVAQLAILLCIFGSVLYQQSAQADSDAARERLKNASTIS